jgi:nucleotide-binding universal stress UspA family protein
MPDVAGEILVPLDGSTNAERAAPFAVTLAAALDLPLRFIHVVPRDGADADQSHAADNFARYAEGFASKVSRGIDHRVSVEYGSAPEVILREAAGARCIVIGSHGRGGLRANLIGSVADRVVRGATVPVFFVPLAGPNDLRSGPLLVALDGSETAALGLAVARPLAKKLDRPVALVRAYSVPGPAAVEFAPYSEDLPAMMEEGAREYLAQTATSGERTFCVLAAPADGVEAAADEAGASLVVVTSQGKNFAKRLVLGSTTERLMHTLRRPLLIVPAQADPTALTSAT